MTKYKAKTTDGKKKVQRNKDKNKARNGKVSVENVSGRSPLEVYSIAKKGPVITACASRGDGVEEDMQACTGGQEAAKPPRRKNK
jgi:hypothetical protein